MAEPATTPTPRRSAAARGCRWLVALVIVAAVAVVPVSVHATGDGLALGRDCAQAAPGSLRVGVVVDFGILASEQGAPSRVAATCASVDAGANGFQALQAAGHTLRPNSAGLLCAIDGYPAGNECGDRTGGGYRYWAYFHGSGGGWSYPGIGPGGTRVVEGSVEGWHFVNGAGNPTDPPPNGPSSATSICPPAPTVPPTTAPPSAPPVTRPPTTVPAPAGGATGGPVPAPPTTAPAPGGPGAAAGAGAADAPTDPSAAPGDPADPAADPAAGAPDAGAVHAGGPDGTAVTPAGADPGSTVELASQAAATRSPASGPSPAVALGVLAVVVLGGVAAFRLRAGRTEA